MKIKPVFKIKFTTILLIILFSFPSCARKTQQQYIFGWQFGEASNLEPRGGISKGFPVEPEPRTASELHSIQEEGISEFEKDRRAILSMAGTYRTSFNFLETAALRENYKIDRPYRSWATEYIEVLEDSGDFISLQHILVMYFINEKGEKSGPHVSKHWRQDWKYEDMTVLEFKGRSTWEKRTLGKNKASGKWTQAVYQVDDSPRYESLGDWEHDENYSRWQSEKTWRPLPRREFSVRSDYDVLAGINIQIITPEGWIHEQHNLKLELDEKCQPEKKSPYIARELGVNRYEKIKPGDYTDGKEYIDSTGDFWKIVRDKWNNVIQDNSSFSLKENHNNKKLFEYLFSYARKINESGFFDKEEAANFVGSIIDKYVENDSGGCKQSGTAY